MRRGGKNKICTKEKAAFKQRVRQCQFCGNTDQQYFEYDQFDQGFWCEICDGYNYINPKQAVKHKFTLILEDKYNPSNNGQLSSSIKHTRHPQKGFLNKRLSPLRYPGGKSKLVEYILQKMQLRNNQTFIEPFAGGASVGLALLDAGFINNLVINDLDFGIYALFSTIIDNPDFLISKLILEEPGYEDYYAAQELIKSDYHNKCCDIDEAAWSMLIVNRLAYSGISKANPLGGKQGNKQKLLSRWNPEDLCKRIVRINDMKKRITVLNQDAFELIEEAYWKPNTTMLIDPPYYKQGKRLYHCCFSQDDHIHLNVLLDQLYQGMPGADIILCYDNEDFIENLYLYPEIEVISRKYTI